MARAKERIEQLEAEVCELRAELQRRACSRVGWYAHDSGKLAPRNLCFEPTFGLRQRRRRRRRLARRDARGPPGGSRRGAGRLRLRQRRGVTHQLHCT